MRRTIDRSLNLNEDEREEIMNELKILLEGIKTVRAEMTDAMNEQIKVLVADGVDASIARVRCLSHPSVQEAHSRLLNLYALIETQTAA